MAENPKMKKTTVMLPADLLEKATKASGQGITSTIRKGLEMIASTNAYDGIRKFKGKYKVSLDYKFLREDR